MAVFSKKDISHILTESVMALYPDYNGIISYITSNKLVTFTNSNSTLSLNCLVSLLDLHFAALSTNEILEACSRLSIRVTHDSESDEYHIIRKRQQYILGSIIKDVIVDGNNMTMIKSNDGLSFCVLSDYIQKDTDSIQSPYNNGLIILTE